MPKFTATERILIQNIVCNLTIKRIPDNEIIKEVYEQTKKTISKVTLFNVRKRVKKESSKWYSQLREDHYEYIHEFKERINEIVDLQRRHYKIIEDGNIKSAVIDPMSTNLGNGEVELWSFAAETKGFFRIKVIISLVVTNFRIMRVDQQNKKVLGYLFTWLDDVVVMNTHVSLKQWDMEYRLDVI